MYYKVCDYCNQNMNLEKKGNDEYWTCENCENTLFIKKTSL